MKLFRTLASVAPAATIFLVMGANMANAEAAPHVARSAKIMIKSEAGQGAARFDWLKVKGPAKTQRIASSIPHGNGSWICSPAGFGRKSRCHRR